MPFTVLQCVNKDIIIINRCTYFLFNLSCCYGYREMMPPASTKTSVYKWNQEITGISKHIGETLGKKGLWRE